MSLTLEEVDDYITYTFSFLWLILVIISLIQLFLEIMRFRKLKKEHEQQLPTPPQFDTPLHLRPTPLPTSHSVSSLSHVYMENGILNVRLGNPRIVSTSPSHRDWNNPSAFIDRHLETPHVETSRANPHMSPLPHVALSKLEIDGIAPVITFVNKPNEDNLTCVICLDPIHQGHRIRNLPCTHSFHAKCILTWLQRANRCPCCAKPIIAHNCDEILHLPTPSPEPQRSFGLGDALVTGNNERPRHDGLWSFSNSRTNGRRGRNEFRGRSNRNLHREDVRLSNGDAVSGRAIVQGENSRREGTLRFEEILEVDYNDGEL